MTSFNYDVVDLDRIDQNPYCPHGPTILFKNEKKKFYSCSACRDHKLCNFYLEYNENKPIGQEKLKIYRDRYLTLNKSYIENFKSLEIIKTMKPEERKFCRTCNKFILNKSDQTHKQHDVLNDITDGMMREPISRILKPVEINSSNAQFVFNASTRDFILSHIKEFCYDSVLCIGTPSIFEQLNELKNVKKMLLDIDERFSQFYSEDAYLKYNMFNNHFFGYEENYLSFLSNCKNMLICIDPPYGGFAKLISNTLKFIKKASGDAKVSTFLFYPYFIETWINKWLPEFRMLDYKVNYENQKKFSKDQEKTKGSPARIFTDIELSKIELPSDQGYAYCKLCNKYTYKENRHCRECNKCTSKDGGIYKHCGDCNRCVKSTYDHCIKCSLCHLKTLKDCKFEARYEKRKLDYNNDCDSLESKIHKKNKKNLNFT